MFGRDFDPLADTAPPRYAYESDDEDEVVTYPIVGAQEEPKKPEVRVSLNSQSQVEERQVLIIANGNAGEVWARGAALGNQVGEVLVNELVIGIVYRPPWLGSFVIVSEALNRLPVDMMSDYAETVIERWKPSRLILLDAYSTPIYAANTLIPQDEAPLRYLQSGPANKEQSQLLSSLEPFAPPNLLQSTTAAFLAISALPRSSSYTEFPLSVLIPSSRTPRLSPQSLIAQEEAYLHPEDWDPAIMIQAHKAICSAAGCESRGWSGRKGSIGITRTRRRVIPAEGNMYI